MIRIALGILFGSWLVIGSFAIIEKIATKRQERKAKKINKNVCPNCGHEN